jgi:mono/diheme cytochrome c family protein
MSEVVGKSSQYLTDQDLTAIAEYLKSLPALSSQEPGTGEKGRNSSDPSEATRALRAGVSEMWGSRTYLDNCNACHRSVGSGAKRTFPALDKNEAVNAQDPVSLIHLVLAGSAMPSTQAAPSALAMPGLGWRLSDEEIADLLSFVRSSWGNHTAAVSPDKVARVRKALGLQKTTM